jgi:hypothetical protein
MEETMHQTRNVLFPAVLTVVLTAGCANLQAGRDFDYSRFQSNVKQGMTDVKEVAEWLGPPMGKGLEITNEGTRLEVWTWYYGRGKVGSDAARQFKMLQVKINEQGKVASYIWSGELAGGAPVEEKSAQ